MTTKRAKKVKIKWEEITRILRINEYQCPVCKTTYRGDNGVTENTVRFKCACGQELICS